MLSKFCPICQVSPLATVRLRCLSEHIAAAHRDMEPAGYTCGLCGCVLPNATANIIGEHYIAHVRQRHLFGGYQPPLHAEDEMEVASDEEDMDLDLEREGHVTEGGQDEESEMEECEVMEEPEVDDYHEDEEIEQVLAIQQEIDDAFEDEEQDDIWLEDEAAVVRDEGAIVRDGDDAESYILNHTSPLPALEGQKLVKLDYLRFALKARMTEESHRNLADTLLMRENAPGILPNDMKNLKRMAWNFFKGCGLDVKDIAPATASEPIPYVSSVQCAYIWMQHPQLSKMACTISQTRTEIHMDFIYENRNNSRLPEGMLEVYS